MRPTLKPNFDPLSLVVAVDRV